MDYNNIIILVVLALAERLEELILHPKQRDDGIPLSLLLFIFYY